MHERFKRHLAKGIILLFIPAIAILISYKNSGHVEFSEPVKDMDHNEAETTEQKDLNNPENSNPPENKWERICRELKNCTAWQEAYINFIHKIHDTDSSSDNHFQYSLIYVDDDDIPELYIYTGCMATGEIIVSFYNGNIGVMNRERIGIAYIEHDGLLYNMNGAMGFYPCNIYLLEKGKFSEIGTGHYHQYMDGQGNIYEDYFWEGRAVTEAEYNASINELIDTSKCIEPSFLYSEAEILELLTENPPE